MTDQLPERHLTDQQREGARLASIGYTGRLIAETLLVRPETVSRWNAIPEYRALVAELVSEIQQETISRLTEMVPRALDILQDGLEYQYDLRLRTRVAMKVLDLAGIGRLATIKQTTDADAC